jgi:hypothetical protein
VLRTLGSSYTWPAVAGGLVGDGELSEVATNHIELDFDRHEALSVVDGDHIADHLGHDDSVSEVGLDGHWLFTWLHIPLGLAALEEEAVVLVLDLYVEGTVVLRLKRRRMRARKSSTIFSVGMLSSCSWV